MTHLPVEVLDNIASLAIALGIITAKDATLVCPRWKLRYQGMLFKSVKLDPFSNDILDLGHPDYKHLIPYIEELCVVRRSDSSTPPNYDRDLTEPFANFLFHAQHTASLLLCDARIRWEHVSRKTVDAFCTVFRCNSFRSLEVFVHKPVPSWILLYGACVASDLTVHCIGPIMPPLGSADLVSYQCSLTRLVLFGDYSIKQITEFCLQHEDLAKDLLRNVVQLVLDYTDTSAWRGSPMTPYPKTLLAFLAPQLELLDLCVRSSSKASTLSNSRY